MPRRAQTPAARRRPWADLIHRGATLGLLGGAIGLALMPPSSPAGDDAPAATSSAPVAPPLPFESIYLPEESTGVLVVHPAALGRRMGTIAPIAELIASANAAGLDIQERIATNPRETPAPIARLRLDLLSIESIVLALEPKLTIRPATGPDEPEALDIGCASSGFAVRTVAPFDWLTWLRSFSLSLQAVQDGDQTYYTIVVPRDLMKQLGSVGQADLKFALTVPDERTLVLSGERWIKTLIHRTTPSSPSFLQGDAWPRISQGNVALALDNTDDTLIKGVKLTDFDEIYLLFERLRGIERLMVGIGISAVGDLTLQAEGVTRDESLARSLLASVQMYQLLGCWAARDQSKNPADDESVRLICQLLQQIRVAATDRTVMIAARNFITDADIAALFGDKTQAPPTQLKPEPRPVWQIQHAAQPARLEQPPVAVPPPPQIDRGNIPALLQRLAEAPEAPPTLPYGARPSLERP